MFTVVLSVFVLMSLVGNTLVILTVLINKPLKTTLNYLLVNLAVADMVFALSILIRYLLIPFITLPEGQTGRSLCTVVTSAALGWIGAAESILCLVYIAVERYFAIIHPLRQRGKFSRRRLKIFVVVGWIFALLFSIPDFLRVKNCHADLRLCISDGNLDYAYISIKVNSLVWLILAGIVPVSIMVYLYSRVVHHLWFKSVQNLEASQKATLRYRKQVTITLIAVSVIYTLCWTPNLTGYLMEYWREKITWIDKTGTVLVTFNSCVNPVLYSMRMKSFRKHLRDMLCCKKRGEATVQAAEMRTRPTTGQPEELTRNTVIPTPFPFSSAFKQEMVTTTTSPYVTSVVTANRGSVDIKTCAKITKGREVHVTGDVGTDFSSCLQENVKIEET